MAHGDTALVMSLVFIVVSVALFLVGFASHEWVHNSDGGTCGLWQKCSADTTNRSHRCDIIKPGTTSAYYEATRTVECFALVCLVVTLISCFTAEDRDSSISCQICVRRYIHAVSAFMSGGFTILAIIIFGACYEDDDWLQSPRLGYSYWVSLASGLAATAGGALRVAFILWPNRPPLPEHKHQTVRAKAPGKRTFNPRIEDSKGADPLPPPDLKRPPGVSPSEKGENRAGLFTISTKDGRTVLDMQGQNGDYNSANRKQSIDSQDGKKSKFSSFLGRRKKGKKNTRTRGKRVSIQEQPFEGYNIPPTPGPDLPDVEEGVTEGEEEVKGQRYEQVIGRESRASTCELPPAVVFPSNVEYP